MEPDELRNISRFINNRFRISPPLVAYYLSPILQGTPTNPVINNVNESTDELYSPTSPLDILQVSDDPRPGEDTLFNNNQSEGSEPQLVLALPVSASMFLGKKRRDASNSQSQSMQSFFRFGVMFLKQD